MNIAVVTKQVMAQDPSSRSRPSDLKLWRKPCLTLITMFRSLKQGRNCC